MPPHRPLAALLTALFLAGSAIADDLADLRWILGDWRADGDRVILESWREVSPRTFEGAGETRCVHTDSLISRETLRLVAMSDGVYYIAKVAHNDRPVAFTLTRGEPGRADFTNPDHDFPNLLSYSLISSDSLSVSVSDHQDNGFIVRFRRISN